MAGIAAFLMICGAFLGGDFASATIGIRKRDRQ
jgi:hypothetical protein